MNALGKAKGIAGVVKLGSAVQKISDFSDPWNILGAMSKSAKTIRALAKTDDIKYAREMVNDIAKTVKTPQFLTGTDVDTQKIVTALANGVLRKTGLPTINQYGALEKISNVLKKSSSPELGNLVDDALALSKKELGDILGAKANIGKSTNPMVHVQEAFSKLGGKARDAILRKVSKSTGVEYKYLQDIPLVKKLSTRLNKEYIPPVVKMLLQPKRTRYYIQNLGYDAESDVVDVIKQLGKKYNANPEELGKEALRMHEKPVAYVFDELLEGQVPEGMRKLAAGAKKAAIEAKGKIYEVFPKIDNFMERIIQILPADKAQRFTDLWEVSKKMRSYYDQQLIRELTTNSEISILELFGAKYKSPVPFKPGEEMIKTGKNAGKPRKPKYETVDNPFYKKMESLQKTYADALVKNPEHPVLATIEKRMQNLLDRVRLQGVIAEFAQKVDPEDFAKGAYVGKAAEDYNLLDKQFMNILSSNSPSKLNEVRAGDFVLYASHIITDDFRKFLEQNSGESIGSLISKEVPFVFRRGQKANINVKNASQIDRNRLLSVLSTSEANKLADEGYDVEKFIKETGEKLTEHKYLIRGFKGKLFKEDPGAILRTRYNRGSYSIQQGLLKRNIQELYRNFPDMFKKREKVGEELGGNWKWIPEIKAYGHPDFAKAIEDTQKFMRTGGNVTWFVKTVDAVNGWFKAMMTVAKFPAFQIRNLVGNIFNSMLSGTKAENMITGYVDALQIVKSLLGKTPLPKLKMVGAGGRLYTAEKIMDIAMRNSLIQSGQGMEILTEMGRGLKSGLTRSQRVKNIALAKPFLRFGAGVNQLFEDTSKIALLIARLREGDSPLKAVDVVQKHLFDYNNITMFEKDVVKRVIPFYVWTKNNLALQIYNMFSLPTRNILKGVKTLQNQDNEVVVNPDYKDAYMKDAVYIPTPFMKKNAARKTSPLLSMSGLIPTFDMSLIVQLVGKNNMQHLLNQVMPTLKTPIEAMANVDLRTGEKIVKYPGDTTQVLGLPMSPLVKKTLNVLQPVNVAETWLGGSEGLNAFGYAHEGRGLSSLWEKALYQVVGKPVVYDERYKRIVASQSRKQDLLEWIGAVASDNKRLRNMYSGGRFPKNDIRKIGNDYANALKAYEEVRAQGLLLDDRVVQNNLKSLGKELLKTIMMYAEKDPEALK
jgi:hypothetical protein